jgi:hypothetical protein
MLGARKGSVLAGLGAIAFGITSVVGLVAGGAPGGSYDAASAAGYLAIGHFPAVVVTAYLALVGVVGLICTLAYLRQSLAVEPERTLVSDVFWGAGLASAAAFGVGWGLVSGIALTAAEGGAGASVPPQQTYVLSDTSLNVLFGSGGGFFGFALVALMLGSSGILPNWLRWVTLAAGVLAITAPFFFTAPAIPIWAIVIGVWLLVSGRTQRWPQAAPRLKTRP